MRLIWVNVRGMLLFLAALVFLCGSAQARTVAIVKSKSLPTYDKAAKRIETLVRQDVPDVDFVVYDLNSSGQSAQAVFQRIRSRKAVLVLTLGTLATQTAKEHVPDLPVVFSFVLNPVASDIVNGFGPSGANLTGVALDISTRVQLSGFKKVVPGLKTIGAFYNPATKAAVIAQAKTAAAGLGLNLKAIAVNSAGEVPKKMDTLKTVDGLWMIADSAVFTPRNTEYILLYTLKEKIPFMGISEQFVKAGALCSVTMDLEAVYAQSAAQVRDVLAGKAAGSIPVAAPDRTKLVLNLKVADKIGIKVPAAVVDSAGAVFR